MKIKGMRFGYRTIISNEIKRDRRSNPFVKTRCSKTGIVKWTNLYVLRSGKANSACKGNQGHSTRTKNKHLPKGVYLTQNPDTKKSYRVCKKIEGKMVTLKYTENLEEATKMASEL